MGGQGSGSRSKDPLVQGLSRAEKVERNRIRAKERWHRLKAEGSHLIGKKKYANNLKVKYSEDEERLAYLRESARKINIGGNPEEWMRYIREKNRNRLDEILADTELMNSIFSDREDISPAKRAVMQQKDYLSDKDIQSLTKRLEEEFNLVEDRRTKGYSTFKPITEE